MTNREINEISSLQMEEYNILLDIMEITNFLGKNTKLQICASYDSKKL
jgi:hypothetical protein